MDVIERLLGGTRAELRGGLRVTYAAPDIEVVFPNQRRQRIKWRVRDGDLVLVTTVATRGVIDAVGEAKVARDALERNRFVQVVTFGLTDGGRLEAWVTHPVDTLDGAELRFYLSQLAREADRWEYLLGHRDVH